MLQIEDQVNVLSKIAAERRLFEPDLYNRLSKESGAKGIPFEQLVLERELLSPSEYLRALENYFFHPAIDVKEVPSSPESLMALSRAVAHRCEALPIAVKDDVLTIAMAKPDREDALTELKAASKLKLEIRVGIQFHIREEIDDRYRLIEESLAPEPHLEAISPKASKKIDLPATQTALLPKLSGMGAGEGGATRVQGEVLREAVRLRATDIHVEPGRDELTVRFRIDGIMQLGAKLSADLTPGLTSRFKIISGMDIAEKRIPQDGRYSFRLEDEIIDCRISSLPSQWGEKIVIRLLKKDMTLLDLNKIQMPPPLLEKWRHLVSIPIGMILVTGPTGSGKTTTLYSTIASLDRAGTNIITLEDPIEYELRGITQVQINAKAGLTFERGLRSILRQDPDTVLVGEIRDLETVETACRAALTGHKIFSTLHTNDSPSAVTRLMDMGVQPYLLVAAVKGVLAQRLLRVLCRKCCETYPPTEVELARLGYPKIDSLKRAVGCPECGHSGYMGRQAVFELFTIDEHMQRMILDRASAYSLREHATKHGMVTIGEVTRRLVIAGITSFAEGERVVFSDEVHEQLCPKCQRVVSLEFSICPFCEYVLKDSCASCGNPVDSDWDICPTCGSELKREWQKKICEGCLAPLEPGWPKCPYCGKEV